MNAAGGTSRNKREPTKDWQRRSARNGKKRNDKQASTTRKASTETGRGPVVHPMPPPTFLVSLPLWMRRWPGLPPRLTALCGGRLLLLLLPRKPLSRPLSPLWRRAPRRRRRERVSSPLSEIFGCLRLFCHPQDCSSVTLSRGRKGGIACIEILRGWAACRC